MCKATNVQHRFGSIDTPNNQLEHKTSLGIRRKIEKIEEEYKARIAELEAKETITPPKQCKARLTEMKAFSTTIALHLEDT